MIIDYKTSTAYICSACSALSEKEMTVFNIPDKGKSALKCASCGQECAYIRRKSNKYIIDIPCSLCGSNHSFPISVERFWDKRPLTLSCPMAGIAIFFMGEKAESATFAKNFNDFVSEFFDTEEDELLDIFSDMIELIYEFDYEHRIVCSCGYDDIEIGVTDTGISLMCRHCGRSKLIKATADNLMNLEDSNSIVIDE